MTWAAEGVLLLEWVDPAGAALPAFEAGAHINLMLPNGLSRSYYFRLDESAPAFALMAGGIGVTPVLAMARRLAALGKPVQIFYALRSRAAAAAFADELAMLVPALTLHCDDEAGGPPDLAAWLGRLPKTTGAYCCGPASMLDGFVAACSSLGLADAHIERFAAPLPSAEATAGCIVTLQRSGRDIAVAPGTSILDAPLAQGIDNPTAAKRASAAPARPG